METTELKPKATYYGKSNVPLDFYELAQYPGEVRFTVGFDDKTGEHHLLGNGILTVDKTEGSFAYGPELQFHLRFTEPLKEKLERAVNNGHDRIEICMDETEGLNFLWNALRGYERLPKKPEMSVKKSPGKTYDKVADFM
jgi:hypothetical protein